MTTTKTLTEVRNSTRTLEEMMNDPKLRTAYATQYRNAIRRKVDFNISFQDWLLVWITAGADKLANRGRAAGQYQMCRYNDRGAYEVGNVYIASIEENLHTAHFGKHKAPAHYNKLANICRSISRKCVVSANGAVYQSMTACGNAHGISAQAVKVRISSNSDQFKDWIKVGERVGEQKWQGSNVVPFPTKPRMEGIEIEGGMMIYCDYPESVSGEL